MKKILKTSLFAATIVLLQTACSNNELDVLTENEAQVTFSLNLENEMYTRAISDGKSVDQLTYAVFNEDGDLVLAKNVVDNVSNLSKGHSLKVTLTKGQNYKAVFWAQDADCDAYSLSDDMNVSINYNGLNNDEGRDAFYAVTESFNVNKNSNVDVVLKRPFAQVIVGVDEEDWAQVQGAGFNITHSSATIKDVANQFNLLEGKVEGNVDVTYAMAPIPSEAISSNERLDSDYKYVSMYYVLADKSRSQHEMSFSLLDSNTNNIIDFENGLSYVPVQRNWRTNIIGKLLTGKFGFNITIDPVFDGEIYYRMEEGVYCNVDADTTIENTVFVMTDFDNSMTLASQSGQTITLNNVTVTGETWAVMLGEYRSASYVNYNNVLNNVVLKDLAVSNAVKDHSNLISVGICAFGHTTFNDCVMKGTANLNEGYTAYDFGVRNESEAVINGGEFGLIYLWTHAVVTINGAKIDRIDSSTCNSTNHSMLTIGAGSEIGVINCTQPAKYPTRLIVEKGAVVEELNLVNSSLECIQIDGTVNKITFNGVVYTLEDLKALNS